MKNNKYQGQLVGPFSANEELMTKINAQSAVDNPIVTHLGIEAEPNAIMIINGNEIYMGEKQYNYEIWNTEVTSIKFKKNMDKNTKIDYVLKKVT